MARTLFGSLLPFVHLTDDEIMAHAEALQDGREPEAPVLLRPVELQDDEIASHLEEGETFFSLLPSRRALRRKPLRH